MAATVHRAGHASVARTVRAGSAVKSYTGAHAVAVYQRAVGFSAHVLAEVRGMMQALRKTRGSIGAGRLKLQVKRAVMRDELLRHKFMLLGQGFACKEINAAACLRRGVTHVRRL